MSENKKIRTGVGAIIFRGGEVLLIRRGKDPFKGQWSIPGGGLEYGESLHQGVRREVREETGVEIEITGLLNVYESLPTRGATIGAIIGPATGDAKLDTHHNIMIDYIAEWKSGEPVAGDDAMEAEFVAIEEALERIAWDTTRTAIKDAYSRVREA